MTTRALGLKFSKASVPLPILQEAETQSPKAVLTPAGLGHVLPGVRRSGGKGWEQGVFDGLLRELPNYPAYQFTGSFPLLFPVINQNPFCYS